MATMTGERASKLRYTYIASLVNAATCFGYKTQHLLGATMFEDTYSMLCNLSVVNAKIYMASSVIP